MALPRKVLLAGCICDCCKQEIDICKCTHQQLLEFYEKNDYDVVDLQKERDKEIFDDRY